MIQRYQGIGMTSQRTRERLVQRLREQGISSDAVLDVFRMTPRHIFVDEALASRAYEDTALPIGYGQTISQPYIVARMTEVLLSRGPLGKVLEIGTGSGFQTTVLAQLVDQVFTVERISALQNKARQRIRELGLHNVRFKVDDGNMGWKQNGPYDAILVTAAPEDLPAGLLEQLAIGGQLIIPTGGRDKQVLRRITHEADGFHEELLENVLFVPLLAGVE